VRRDKELGALTEALPLVALGTIAASLAGQADNALLVKLGARAHGFGQGAHFVAQLCTLANSPAMDRALCTLAAIDTTSEDDARWDRMVTRWRQTVTWYCQTTRDHSLTAFLHFTALADAVDLPEDAAGRVTMLTIHSAKGQEWPLVFLIGVEDDQFPIWHAEAPDAVEEERRVFYVGMTRAQRRLCLLWSSRINGYQKEPSRFLADLPGDLMKHRGRRLEILRHMSR
jgi:superfamily I DNA/RNA helicase